MPNPPSPVSSNIKRALARRVAKSNENSGQNSNQSEILGLLDKFRKGLPLSSNPTNKSKVSTYDTPGFKKTTDAALTRKAAIERRLSKRNV